jgi:hypothetical protein
LARQQLLRRAKIKVPAAMECLCGLQAQRAWSPHAALWSRIEGFEREKLTKPLHRRQIVRATLMRATLHLVSAGDYFAWRKALAPVMEAALAALPKDRLRGLDAAAVTEFARGVFGECPRTFGDLRERLREVFPGGDDRVMGYAVRLLVPLVVVPDDSDWALAADGEFALAEDWLGKGRAAGGSVEALVPRYLAAFGPATAADMQRWSGLKGLKPVFEALRPPLAVFLDERKRELFDLPEAPRPPEDTAAPVRFLPEFDNVLLGCDDRARIVAEEHRPRLVTKNLLVPATFLVDGFVAGTWRVDRTKKAATFTVSPFAKLSRGTKDELGAEAEKLARFLEPEAGTVAIEFA